jgi:uncharacterized protein YdeI (YjbR/CyaY-like superfamily)
MPDDRSLLTFKDRDAWRRWLKVNCGHESKAWLVIRKKSARQECLSLEDAVLEALCFGWIDGKLETLDKDHYALRFSPRRSDSVWSLGNIRRVEKLMAEGLMTEAGYRTIREGHESGQWDAAIKRERVDQIPPDLERILRRRKGALSAYRNLPASRKKQILHRIMTAKRQETRLKRIDAIVDQLMR